MRTPLPKKCGGGDRIMHDFGDWLRRLALFLCVIGGLSAAVAALIRIV